MLNGLRFHVPHLHNARDIGINYFKRNLAENIDKYKGMYVRRLPVSIRFLITTSRVCSLNTYI